MNDQSTNHRESARAYRSLLVSKLNVAKISELSQQKNLKLVLYTAISRFTR